MLVFHDELSNGSVEQIKSKGLFGSIILEDYFLQSPGLWSIIQLISSFE